MGRALGWLLPPTWGDIEIVSGVYAGVVILVLPPAIWQTVKRRVRPCPWAQGFALMLITTIALPFAISCIKPLFYSRFTIVGMHLFALVIAACVTRVAGWQIPAWVSAIALGSGIYVAAQPRACDARWGAQYLAEQASASDSVIFTSLSRAPVDHYLLQLASQPPNAPSFSETTFPAEIDAHPSYEGPLQAPGRDVGLTRKPKNWPANFVSALASAKGEFSPSAASIRRSTHS